SPGCGSDAHSSCSAPWSRHSPSRVICGRHGSISISRSSPAAASSSPACGCGARDMATSDDIIHQPLRLRIMAALAAGRERGEEFDFARLKSLTQASDGNLGAHIETLERANYVEVERGYQRPPPPLP